MFTLIFVLTGVAGFVLCQGMLWLGLFSMGIRYPLAVLGAYGIFLLLLRAWVGWEHFKFDHRVIHLPEPPPGVNDDGFPENGKSQRSLVDSYSNDTGWLDWLDVGSTDLFDSEGCLLVILLGLLLSMLGFVGFAIAEAPVLITEVFLDSVLVSVLYRTLRRSNTNRWLGTAIRRTWSRVLWLAALLAVLGAFLQMLTPDCHSLGQMIEKWTRTER